MSSEVAIAVESLSKRYEIYSHPRDRLLQFLSFGRREYYREFWALRDVSFSIGRGETVGIIGRNGSGKSTLLQLVCGTVSPTTGSVSTSGRVAALLELGAGFNMEFTGRENVLLNAAILGFPQQAIEERMADVLAFSELGDYLDQPVKTYSSGMYARLAFAIAIHVDPEILIVDETLAVGDVRFVAKCMRRIKEIQERGAAILFVSHDVNSVRTLCDRAIWLDKGMLIEDGDVFPITGKYMEFMLGDEESEETKARHRIAEKTQAEELPRGALSTAEPVVAAAVMNPSLHAIDERPVTHWGSRRGLILGASVCDDAGVRRDVASWGAPMEVVIALRVPLDIQRDNLSVAFSIKDLKGTDLIVSTTRDHEALILPGQERFTVRYRLTNSLVTGNYLLVAAVERRVNMDIHYYEYVEGAHYFSSVAEQRFFGIFQPLIQQVIEVQ